MCLPDLPARCRFGRCCDRQSSQWLRGQMVRGLHGVLAALAGDFGVSERFIAVRLSRYGLLQGGV